MPAGLKLEFDTEEFLKGLGISGETISRIRLGRGVVGRVSYVAALTIAALALIAYKASGERLRIGIAATISIVFLIYFFRTLRFAEKHKDLALLEGAELLALRQMELRAKSVPNPPQQPVLPDPGNRPLPDPDSEPTT